MKGMGRIQHLFTICSFWANANPSGKPHGSCEQCVRTLKVADIYAVEEADSLFRRGGRDIGEIVRHADRKRHQLFRLLRRGLNRPAEQPLAQPARILQPDQALTPVPVPLVPQVLVGRIVLLAEETPYE